MESHPPSTAQSFSGTSTVDAMGDERDGSALIRRHAILKRYQDADQVLGKRWVGLIVRALLNGPSRFSEIASCIGVLSDRMLSARLGELEARGIVERRVDGDAKPVRIEYALTHKGRALEPVVREIGLWADRWVREDEYLVANNER